MKVLLSQIDSDAVRFYFDLMNKSRDLIKPSCLKLIKFVDYLLHFLSNLISANNYRLILSISH